MSSFNLVDEPWIPCVTSGDKREELGLQDTLVRAHDILEIHDPSPLVTASLHRLLLAVLHRVFGPGVVADWQKLWQAGHFEPLAIDGYFKKWHSRFYLFDNQYPFYQLATFQTKNRTPLKRLAFEYAAQHNVTLFDHSSDSLRPEYPPSQATRWLVASQAFSPSAGKSETIHTKDSPWSRGAAVIAYGNTLFETLMFNMVPSNLRSGALKSSSIPVWEDNQPMKPQHGAVPKGYLDYLTWQSRAIRLLRSNHGDGGPTVSECCLAQGKSLVEDFSDDPLLGYQRDKKGGFRVWQLNPDRAVWRDSSSLFSRSSNLFLSPKSLELFALLLEGGTLQPSQVFQLSVLGQLLKRGKPTIYLWRHERMPLPLAYLANQDLVNYLDKALRKSEAVDKSLISAVKKLAGALVRKDDDKARNLIADHLKPSQVFWSRLERPFYETMENIPKKPERALSQWDKTLRQTAWQAFEASTCSLDHSARTIKALEAARRSLAGGLAKVLPKEVNDG